MQIIANFYEAPLCLSALFCRCSRLSCVWPLLAVCLNQFSFAVSSSQCVSLLSVCPFHRAACSSAHPSAVCLPVTQLFIRPPVVPLLICHNATASSCSHIILSAWSTGCISATCLYVTCFVSLPVLSLPGRWLTRRSTGGGIHGPLLGDRMTHFHPFHSVIFFITLLCFAARIIFHHAELIAAISHENPLSFHYLTWLSTFISFETTNEFNNTNT